MGFNIFGVAIALVTFNLIIKSNQGRPIIKPVDPLWKCKCLEVACVAPKIIFLFLTRKIHFNIVAMNYSKIMIQPYFGWVSNMLRYISGFNDAHQLPVRQRVMRRAMVDREFFSILILMPWIWQFFNIAECLLPNQMQCANGQCTSVLHVCDKDNDCGDMSDETGCRTDGW